MHVGFEGMDCAEHYENPTAAEYELNPCGNGGKASYEKGCIVAQASGLSKLPDRPLISRESPKILQHLYHSFVPSSGAQNPPQLDNTFTTPTPPALSLSLPQRQYLTGSQRSLRTRLHGKSFDHGSTSGMCTD